jgi:cytosine/adenosine deaminase-related metal-dependent hydrolase
MSDEEILSRIVRRESRSFLQYVRDSFPWASVGDAAIRDGIVAMADKEADRIAQLARFLQARRVPLPVLGPFPTSFTNSNFLAAQALIPRLLDDARHRLTLLNHDAELLHDEQARSLVEAFRQEKQEHLHRLEAMRSFRAAPTMAAAS